MADPRKAVIYTDIDRLPLSYKYDGSIVYDATKAGGSASVGLAVTLTGANQVGLGTDGARLEGELELVEGDGFCTVNTRGGMGLPAAGVLANGSKVVCGANGQIRVAVVPGGAYAQGTATDQANGRGEVVDGSVAADIQIILR
jgi:hypothetical protein